MVVTSAILSIGRHRWRTFCSLNFSGFNFMSHIVNSSLLNPCVRLPFFRWKFQVFKWQIARHKKALHCSFFYLYKVRNTFDIWLSFEKKSGQIFYTLVCVFQSSVEDFRFLNDRLPVIIFWILCPKAGANTI